MHQYNSKHFAVSMVTPHYHKNANLYPLSKHMWYLLHEVMKYSNRMYTRYLSTWDQLTVYKLFFILLPSL